MRISSLRVRSFGCVEEARLELGPGVNVLYGPNDLGKSTLAHAIRAALLLPSGHREAEGFRPWHRDATPEVQLVFVAPDEPGAAALPRTWRVHKVFGSKGGQAELEGSNDAESYFLEQKGPGVDTRLRQLLGWGVAEARARGSRGFPSSFLATVLLGPQAVPGSVLGRSLEDDPSESGRERLTEALQALAQDPRFKDVLDQAQRKVDEAFTPLGKPKKGKASPLTPVRQEIDVLETRLRDEQARVHDSESVRAQLLALEAARTEAIVTRDEADAALQRAQAAFERGLARARVQVQEQQAQAALEQARAVLAERRQWQEAAERHLGLRPAAEAGLERARQAEQEATQRLMQAEAALRAIEEGGDAQVKLARQGLETRRLELRGEHERTHAQLQRVEEALRLAARLEALAQEREALGQDLAAAEHTAAQAEAGRREADAERRLYDAALRLRRFQQAQARVDAAEAALLEVERLTTEASAGEAEVTAEEAALHAQALPEPTTLDAWRALEQERHVALARLGVGLSLVVHRSGLAPLAASLDERPAAPVAVGEPVEALRRLRLQLGDSVELEVQGGDPRARAARDAIEARWAQEVAPALARLGVDGLPALQARLLAAQQRRQALERLRQDVESKRRLAAARHERVAELPALRRTLDACAQALAGLDRDTLQARAGQHDEATLERRRAEAEARIDESQHRHAEAKSRAASLRSQQEAREQEHQRLAAELVPLRPTGDPEEERDALFDRIAAIEGEQETVSDELAELDQARARRRAEAVAVVRDAQAEADRTRVASAQARRELEDRRDNLAQAEGRLAQLQSQASRIDEAALRAELERVQDQLRALPEPEPPVSAEQLEAARAEQAARQQVVRELEAAFDQQRGALKHVGGAIARERAQQLEEALAAAKQRERDLELDYAAWRLLTATLREAETAEGRHLGEALGEPVHRRFAALTGGRYGALKLGRDLRAEGLEVAGAARDLSRFSEGVQDQLATILRLAIAEYLGTALVLDDHLAQTDPGRVAWFRELLLQVGQRAQIVVLTCRPEDYLREGEQPGDGQAVRDSGALRAIDLTRVIRRAGDR
jgi:AAA domain